jgi:glycosyltransferase involved in cell wall biosynthesis
LDIHYAEYRRPEEVPATIQSFDIGVNPLANKSEWNLARSSFKPYEYMACGVAQITSAVGEITTVVHNGENGFLADSDEEWVLQLHSLIEDRILRARLGKAGQETMRTRESLEMVMPRLVDIIEDIGKNYDSKS